MTPGELQALLREHGIHLARARGQNFLTDSQFLRGLVRLAGVGGEDAVLEIGTGFGTLTRELAAVARQVITYEVDRKVAHVARSLLGDLSNVDIRHEDFLKATFPPAGTKGGWRIVANLPYSIASQVLLVLWRGKEGLQDIHFMVQTEFAERLSAAGGTRRTGVLSICLQSDFDIRILKKVPPDVFFPKPRVTSSFVRMTPKPSNLPASEREALLRLVKKGFENRRKKLLTRLKPQYPNVAGFFEERALSVGTRAEQLTVTEWLDLHHYLRGPA